MIDDNLLDFHFVRTPSYETSAKGVFSDKSERSMEEEIAENPKGAPVIAQTGGVRKIRVAIQGRGKSGSARVLYLYIERDGTVYLIWAYPKNVSENISDSEKKAIRKLVKLLKAEHED